MISSPARKMAGTTSLLLLLSSSPPPAIPIPIPPHRTTTLFHLPSRRNHRTERSTTTNTRIGIPKTSRWQLNSVPSRGVTPEEKIEEAYFDHEEDGGEIEEEESGDEDEDEEDDDGETESSMDLLFRFIQSMFNKLSKRAKKATRSMLPPAISPQLVSFAVDGVLLLTLLSIVKALLQVVCTLGGTVFVVILMLRVIWATASHFQSTGNSFDQKGSSYGGTTQPFM